MILRLPRKRKQTEPTSLTPEQNHLLPLPRASTKVYQHLLRGKAKPSLHLKYIQIFGYIRHVFALSDVHELSTRVTTRKKQNDFVTLARGGLG